MPTDASVAWSHPQFKSIVLRHVLTKDTTNKIKLVVPSAVLPSHCRNVEEVVNSVESSSFWDDILYANQAKNTLHSLNRSMVGSPRERNFSKSLGTTMTSNGRCMNKLYWYPRRYVPCTDYKMSPMPTELGALCKEAFEILFELLPEASRKLGPFNSVQVRGYYEAFKPHTGAHSDNGLLDKKGNVRRDKGSAQVPNTVVAIYMIGDCPMRLDFMPFRDKRPQVSIPLRDGMLMMLHPEDDCRCKHSIELDIPLSQLRCDRYRLAFVMRHLFVVREYDASTRALNITEEKE